MKRLSVSCLLFAAVMTSFAQSTSIPKIDIPYKKFVLDNGLRLIVHEDHKAPIVAVNIWYHVGSKNEKPGKSGFAHLFEHLMFNGSEHFNKDYFKALESIGATDLNGTTSEDRTNYFQNIPVEALDQVLWLESDRMGFMTGAIDSARLNEQRGVVQNEKRQGENEPYAIGWEITAKNTYPAGHPYSWTIIGSMEDLNAASLTDVKDWFKSYYGPNNAVLVIAGDIDANTALEKVKKYFGAIPPSPPITKQGEWLAKMKGSHRQYAQDRVPQPRLQKVWNVPAWGSKEIAHLGLLNAILTDGKSSRLYKRIVYDEQLATNINSFIEEREIGSQFYIMADAKPQVPLSKIESIIQDELNRIIKTGVTPAELDRAKTQHFSGMVKGLERVGGFGGKSDILAENEVYGNSPDYYKKTNDWIRTANPEDIKKVATEWLSDGDYSLEIQPYPTLQVSATDVDRSTLPPLGKSAAIKFPEVEKFTLSNGLQVMLARRTSVPVVNMRLMLDAGYAADQPGKTGLASMTMKMLSEGTKTKNALQISDLKEELGTGINSWSTLDNSLLSMNALTSNFDKSLALFADVLINPVFPDKELDRVKKNQLLDIKQEEAQPIGMGLRILPKILYGDGHAYSAPLTGSGFEADIKSVTRKDLVDFHQKWFVPNSATLMVVGDISAQELQSKLEANLAGWKQKPVPAKNIAEVALPAKPNVYIMDKPDALQTIIFSAELAPSAKTPDWMNVEMMNRILGGEFTSRINMNLREDKHWSYGSGSFIFDAKGQGMFISYAPVQTDKTKESIIELKKEIEQYLTNKPPTSEEFNKVQQNAIMQLPGGWETNNAVLSSMQDQVQYNRGDDYWPNYADKIKKMTLDDIKVAASKVIKPAQLTWIIVGDRKKIEAGISELNLGEIKYIDTNTPEKKAF
ncbi:M16 family metallopeptidase [Flavihumibacter fluvii]|uniref:M16 family metallopeptidase n=1 Tax=Flavihumibacter fluvii TaxID=2838157 RepID=UPI001BDE1EDB|nr:pitrilysin family protein [Flavihumibacter fluvii]ULQ52691.1 insulinase family protein [Flavihumibacter fluvii]